MIARPSSCAITDKFIRPKASRLTYPCSEALCAPLVRLGSGGGPSTPDMALHTIDEEHRRPDSSELRQELALPGATVQMGGSGLPVRAAADSSSLPSSVLHDVPGARVPGHHLTSSSGARAADVEPRYVAPSSASAERTFSQIYGEPITAKDLMQSANGALQVIIAEESPLQRSHAQSLFQARCQSTLGGSTRFRLIRAIAACADGQPSTRTGRLVHSLPVHPGLVLRRARLDCEQARVESVAPGTDRRVGGAGNLADSR